MDLEAEKGELEYIGIYKNYVPMVDGKIDKEFAYTYLLKYDGSAEDLDIDEHEVGDVKFIPIEKIYSDIGSENPDRNYSPYGEYYTIALDSIRDRLD